MALIDDYANNPQQALIDAVTNPVFRNFIDPSDIEVVIITVGGVQAQAQALKATSVAKVLDKVIAAAKQAKIDLLHWICTPGEFNLCHQLKNSLPGVAMTDLQAFLLSRFGATTTGALSVFAAFSSLTAAVTIGQFLAIFAALGVAYNELARLCKCP